MAQKKIRILGETIKYRNIPDLAKKINIGDNVEQRRMNARFIMNNIEDEKVIYRPARAKDDDDEFKADDGNFHELNLKDKPLLIRQYLGVARLPRNIKNAIIKRSSVVMTDLNDDIIEIRRKSQPFEKDQDVLNVYYHAVFRIYLSGTQGTALTDGIRHVDGIYQGLLRDNTYLYKHLTITPTLREGKQRQQNLFRKGNKEDQSKNYKIRSLEYSTVYDNDNKNDDYKFNDSIEDGSFFNTLKDVNIRDLQSYFTIDVIRRIFKDYAQVDKIVIDRVFVYPKGSNREFDLRRMKLKHVVYDDISTNLFNEIIEIKNDDKNCVLNYLEYCYGSSTNRRRINISKFFECVDTSDGINTFQILDFCKKYNIKCICYDIDGQIIGSFYPQKKNKQYKSLIYIAHNNHMYPIKNKLLNKKTIEYDKVCKMSTTDVKKKFNELLENHIIPAEIFTHHDRTELLIKSFVHDNTLYFNNDDYDDCYEILKLFGIQDHIKPFTTRFNIMQLLEELYGTLDNFSFFPSMNNYILTPAKWHTDKKDFDEDELYTIDKNKAYGYALSLLPFIICGDERNIKINDNPTEIKEYCIYDIKTHEYSYILPHSGKYEGYYLLKVKNEGITFDLVKEYETETRDNKYKSLIDDYYTKTRHINCKMNDETIIKNIVNIWLGKLEKPTEEITKIKIQKICTKDESNETDGYCQPYNDKYDFIMSEKKNYRVYNRKLLKMQIMNMSRWIIYEKMKELHLKDDDVIQIKTDAITFKNKYNIDISKLDKDDYKLWKEGEYTTIDGDSEYINDKIVCIDMKHNLNRLYQGYAGCGKTYKILHDIIPQLEKDNRSYIILSPNHSSLEEYRKNNKNCDVIQTYIYSNTIPKEDIIIIDEIGLCDKQCNDIIYKCYLAGKQLLSFGDFGQLPPVREDRPFNNISYLRQIYNKCILLKTNQRNNFTLEYYDKLRNEQINLINELIKYSTKNYYESECIICFTNAQCDKWNEKYMKHHNIKFGEIGFKTICKTNKYRRYGIYNNFIMTITDKNDEFITLDNIFKIPVKKFIERKINDKGVYTGIFGAGYARTQYNIQGKSLKSFYIPDECYKYFNNGRSAYTIISRLKEELNERPHETPITIIEEKQKVDVMKISFDDL